MRKRKKKSGFQKLTIVMAWFMAVITLLGVVATALIGTLFKNNIPFSKMDTLQQVLPKTNKHTKLR